MIRPPRLRALRGLSQADALKKLNELEQRARGGLSCAIGVPNRRAARAIVRRLQQARAHLLIEQGGTTAPN